MTTQEAIEQFFGWAEERREEINKISIEAYSRILLLSLLDSIAKCAFAEEHNNKKRFVKLIDIYSRWVHKDRVSLLQLQCLLDDRTEPKLEYLKKVVEKRLKKWPPAGFGRMLFPRDVDPVIEQFRHFTDEECRKLVERARYASLLWVMRNFSVHEFRTPGQGMDLMLNDLTPYYHGLTDLETQERTWEFYIPKGIISELIVASSRNLKRHFEEKAINPYEQFRWGTSWFSD